MGVPSTRTPVRVARGTYANLTTTNALAALQEGEIAYATDTNTAYVVETESGTKALRAVTGIATSDLVDEDNMASNSATKVPSQQSVKAYVDTADATKAPLASPTITGTVAIPNIANLETAVAANTAKVTNVTTNLSVTANGTSLTVESSDGTDASIPAVTTSAWGAMTDEDKTKLDGIATGATANTGDSTKAGANVWTGVNSNPPEDTPAATGDITIDFTASNNYKVTLTGNAVFKNPTTEVVGASGSIFIKQDGTGGHEASWESQFHWAGGTAGTPTLTSTAGAVDRIDYICYEAGAIHCVATLDIKAGA